MTTRLGGVTVLCAASLVAAPARGQEGPPVSVHGFVSQGYLQTSDNRYLGARTDEGTLSFNEVALNFNTRPIEGLRVGAQLFARDLGPQGNHRVVVDWAVGDYRIRNWLGIRAGRVKLPVGLYNTLRDVEVSRAEILQPSSIYPLSMRDLAAAFDGVSVYGTTGLGGGFSLDYEAFAGAQDLDDAFIVNRLSLDGALNLQAALSRAGLEGVDFSTPVVDARQDSLVGLALVLRLPVPGLRAGASYLSSDSTIESESLFTARGRFGPSSFLARTQTRFGGPGSFTCVGSLEYQRDDLRLAAEYLRDRRIVVTTTGGVPGPPAPPLEARSDGEAFYVQAVYRFDDAVQAQAYYARIWSDRDDREGRRFRDEERFRASTRDLALTLRFDIVRHWLLKLEFHRFDGASILSPAENRDGFERRWNLFAVKTTLYF